MFFYKWRINDLVSGILTKHTSEGSRMKTVWTSVLSQVQTRGVDPPPSPSELIIFVFSVKKPNMCRFLQIHETLDSLDTRMFLIRLHEKDDGTDRDGHTVSRVHTLHRRLFTCVQHRQGQQDQVGAATGAEHAGKHEEDRTPEGRRQESACETHSWNTHSVRSPRVSNVLQRTDVSVRPRLTNKQTSYCHLQVKGQREVVGNAQEQDWWWNEQQQESNITSAFF